MKNKQDQTITERCGEGKKNVHSCKTYSAVLKSCAFHRQPKLNIREPLNCKDLHGNTTDLCKMVETNIVLSIKST